MFDPTRYRELIDHLDQHSHQIWHGDADEMDAAMRAARMLPELLAASTAVLDRLDYLQQLWGKEGVTNTVAEGLRTAIKQVEEVPNATMRR